MTCARSELIFEICNSIGSAFIAWFKKPPFIVVVVDIGDNFLLAALDHQYAIDGKANYNYISSIDDVAEPLNQPLYAQIIDPTVDLQYVILKFS